MKEYHIQVSDRRMHGTLRFLAIIAVSAGCTADSSISEDKNEIGEQSSAVISHPRLKVGVRCQEDFQNIWAATLNGVWDTCNRFGSRMSWSDEWTYYYNLHGGKWPLESSGDGCGAGCGGSDAVDIFFLYSHGGNWGNQAIFAMWDDWSTASSISMRLGDTDRGLSVFAGYACDTFQTSDGGFVNRWYPAFAGGLRVGLGAHGLVYDGNPQKGTEFASRMEDGEAISLAWNEAVWYADNRNTPSAATTGANSTDCWNRHGATLGNLTSLPRLRDWQIGYLCWSGWNGI